MIIDEHLAGQPKRTGPGHARLRYHRPLRIARLLGQIQQRVLATYGKRLPCTGQQGSCLRTSAARAVVCMQRSYSSSSEHSPSIVIALARVRHLGTLCRLNRTTTLPSLRATQSTQASDLTRYYQCLPLWVRRPEQRNSNWLEDSNRTLHVD